MQESVFKQNKTQKTQTTMNWSSIIKVGGQILIVAAGVIVAQKIQSMIAKAGIGAPSTTTGAGE